MKNLIVFLICCLPQSVFALIAKDDCEFIRQKLYALPLIGGEVLIPQGIFDCRTAVIIEQNNVVLRGAGQDKTILRLANQVHAPLLIVGSPMTVQSANGEYVVPKRVQNITVADLTLDGNLANHNPLKECGEGICDGDPNSVRNNGISIRGASNIIVQNVTAHSMISGGMVTEKHCRKLKIQNFTAYNNYFDGFAGYETEHSELSGLFLHHNRGAGISIDINFNYNVIRDSRLYDNGDVAIFARDLNGNLFHRVDIQRSGNHGVFMANSGDFRTCARNNEFRSVSINHSKRSALRLNDDCDGNMITGASNLCNNSEGGLSEGVQGKVKVDTSVLCW